MLNAIGETLQKFRNQELPDVIGFVSDSGRQVTYMSRNNLAITISISGLRNASRSLLKMALELKEELLEGLCDQKMNEEIFANDLDPGFRNRQVGEYVIFGGTSYNRKELSCILPNHLSKVRGRGYLNKIDAMSGTLSDVPEANTWLKKYRKLQEYLMVLVYMTMGGAPRISELVETLFLNTKEGQRSLYVIPSTPAITSRSDEGEGQSSADGGRDPQNHRNQFVLVLRYSKIDNLPKVQAKARCFLIWKELEDLWRLNYAVLRPTAMSITMNLKMNVESKKLIQKYRQQGMNSPDAERKTKGDFADGNICQTIFDDIQKMYSPLFVGRYQSGISSDLFKRIFGELTAPFFLGADAKYNPLPTRMFRQAFTVIMDIFAPRAAVFSPSSYGLNVVQEHQQHHQQHQSSSTSTFPSSSSGMVATWYSAAQSQRYLHFGGSGRGNIARTFALLSDVEAGAVNQTGHTLATHTSNYSLARCIALGLELHESNGLSSLMMNQEFLATEFFQNVILGYIALDVLSKV